MAIGVNQLLIILAIIVLLFGAKKIPELAKGLGKGIKSFKAEMEEPVQKVEEKPTQTDMKETDIKETTKNA
ncbi:twin-arginine translocase TatA/TatE family subunit [Campylobacter sp. faydin G-24]|uniref:Sec-independent protein translocase protein TatA n=1 Tax=Campylobacter anatolicus TaxID=2829105 RepID=A0ABS5HGQ4_9BACT|nr:twin-arginine translocase TatA/TatE family subunit [Campylobacter anatolicus]MBR8461674.1 twin-arginine translocase TatA/TatE family subunit [Campylobacter anatolicus]MBR8463410.1 twin-arginine translocase TatA/TatE family subunit [Campylobacter anatolicus]MBR8465237.1 twin-arginine translocase TatA/TatE family subunit [Campylobacter anatolicus]